MVGKERSFRTSVSRRNVLQRLDGVDFGEAPARRLDSEPGEKARDRRAVALVRGARAGELRVVLRRFHQRDRVGADHGLAAGALEDLG